MAENVSQLSILVKVRDEASAALSRLSGDVSDLGSSLNWASLGAGALAGGMAAIAGAAILSTIKAFADSEVQMARFSAIMKTLPADLQKYRDEILKTAEGAMKFGFSNESAAVTIARFLGITGNMKDALFGLQTTMDLARLKGMSLEQATDLLAKAWVSGGRVLSAFGIDVDEHIKGMGTWIIVAKNAAGQAEGFAGTLRGVQSIMSVYIDEVKKVIGQPFAEFIKSVVLQFKDWIDTQRGVNAVIERFRVLLVIVGALLTGVFVAGIMAATAVALAAIGSFGLVVAAIGALIGVGAALYAAWKTNFLGLRDFIMPIIDGIVRGFNNLIDIIKGNIGLFDFLGKTFGGMAAAIGGDIKKLFGLQMGGIVTRPTFAMLGEAGAEAVIPLNRLGGVGLGGGINIYLQGDFYTTEEIAEKFAGELARLIKLQIRV